MHAATQVEGASKNSGLEKIKEAMEQDYWSPYTITKISAHNFMRTKPQSCQVIRSSWQVLIALVNLGDCCNVESWVPSMEVHQKVLLLLILFYTMKWSDPPLSWCKQLWAWRHASAAPWTKVEAIRILLKEADWRRDQIHTDWGKTCRVSGHVTDLKSVSMAFRVLNLRCTTSPGSTNEQYGLRECPTNMPETSHAAHAL